MFEHGCCLLIVCLESCSLFQQSFERVSCLRIQCQLLRHICHSGCQVWMWISCANCGNVTNDGCGPVLMTITKLFKTLTHYSQLLSANKVWKSVKAFCAYFKVYRIRIQGGFTNGYAFKKISKNWLTWNLWVERCFLEHAMLLLFSINKIELFWAKLDTNYLMFGCN